ncbi:MAG: hypothetical protein IPK29_20200 [Betaproteobacteria bacterium]|nr:hypothetical protein [Betaproteobacteria bacterium]
MYGMTDGGPAMWGMGLVWLLVVADLVLVGAAAGKYLFFDNRGSASANEQDRR